MKIENNNLIIRQHTFDLNQIALIGVQQSNTFEEFGLEVNYWLEFKLINGEKVDIESSHTHYEAEMVRKFRYIKELFEAENINQFVSLGYMMVNLHNVKDIQFINKNKGIEIIYDDFHIDYPQLGKWRAKKAIKKYNQKVKEMAEQTLQL